MPFEIVGQASRASGRANEDVAAAARHGAIETAWVLDGATGLAARELVPEGPTDAAWLARALSTALGEIEPGGLAARDYFARVIDRVATQYYALVPDHAALPAYALPSAAGVWLRAEGARFDLAFQGDCVAVVEQGDAVSVFGVVDQTGAGRVDDLIAARPNAEGKLLDLLGDDLRHRRARLNQPGGYWMLGIEPRAAAAMSVEIFQALPGTRVLLCSDGYWRLVDHFGRYDAAGLLHTSFGRGPDALLDELRTCEAADPDCRAFPRIKPMDDATALILRF